MAPGRYHTIATEETKDRVTALLPPGYHATQEQPIARRFEDSVPQPDVAVLRASA